MRNKLAGDILLLEDEFIISESLRGQLLEFGFENVHTAFKGADALEIARQHPLQFAIVDIKVPGEINGIEVARQLKQICDCPLLFLTAYSDDQTLSEALAVGPYNYLVKPWKERDLYIAIEVALVKFNADRELKERLVQLEADLGNRRQQEIERLTARNRELEELVKFRDHLLSVLSHDISSPLRSISGMSNILLDDPELITENNRIYIESIADTSYKGLTLLEHLLHWSSSKMSMITFKPAQFNLLEQTNTTLNIMQGQIRHKKLKVQLIPDTSPLNVYADRDMVAAILSNLLSNAIKYSEEGEKIIIQSGPDKDGYVFVCVQDFGIGIEEKRQKNLLNPELGTRSILGTSGEKGLGIGLNIATAFVQRNGGQIQVKSKPGQGSSFTFTLPVAPGENQ